MAINLEAVLTVNFAIDFMLLLGTNRICGSPLHIGRCAIAAVIGGVYATVCMLPSFQFLAVIYWRFFSLCIVSAVAYGLSFHALRRGVVLLVLRMAMSGMTLGLNIKGIAALFAPLIVVIILCQFGFQSSLMKAQLLPVELTFMKKTVRITALRDTGNMLYDPVTGKPIIIVDATIAEELTGLSIEQLRNPIRSLTEKHLSGLRLIPYRTIDRSDGMLLALRMSQVKIGKKTENVLVAFSPEKLSGDGTYQALTGGTI